MRRTLSKSLALFLVLILAIGLLPVNALGITAFAATTDPDGFTRITTAQELDTLVRNGLTGKFRLHADIDLASYAYNSSTWTAKNGWEGIGSLLKPFKGALDGNGHTIKGLWSKDRGSDQGLFVWLYGATIQNLTIELAPAGITGFGERKGALSGNAYDGTVIDNVHVYGAEVSGSPIEGGANYIAGLVGVVYKSTVKNASVQNVKLSGLSYVAGLAGIICHHSNVSESYVEKVNVYASMSYAGGFAGGIYDVNPVVNSCAVFDSVVTAKGAVAGGFTAIAYDTANLSMCYVDGITVKAHSYAGGFAGQIHGSAVVSISCAQNGTAATTDTYVAGGFVGELAHNGVITNCYAQIDVTSKTSGAGSFVGYYSDVGISKLINNTYGAGTVTAGLSLNYGAYAGFTGASHGRYTGTNYYDSSLTAGLPASGSYSNGVGSGLPKGYNTATMMKQATFVGWDFATIWRIDENITYPYFLWAGNMFGVSPEISKTSRNVTSADAETRVNDILEYTVTAQNNGSGASWNTVSMVDVLPTGVTYVMGSAKLDGVTATASYESGTRTLTVPIDGLAPGEKKTVTFQVSINANAYGMTIQNSVTVKGQNSRTGADVERSVTDNSIYTVYGKSATPVINSVSEGDRTVSGMGVPGAQILVLFPDDAIAYATVSASGQWTANVPATTTLVVDDAVFAWQTEAGKTLSNQVYTIVIAQSKSAAPVINMVTEGDRTVSGTGVAGAQIIVVFPDGMVDSVIVSPGGQWIVNVPAITTLVAGNTVTARQIEAGKSVSDDVNTVVTGRLKSAAPVINTIIEGDRTVSGAGVANSKIEVTLPDGSKIETTVNDSGRWVIDLPAGMELIVGNKVSAVQTELSKEPSDSVTATVYARHSGTLEPGEVSADKLVVPVDDETFEITLSVAGRSFETEEKIKAQVDVVLLVDVSGSMLYGWNSDGPSTEPSRIELTKEAAKNAVDKILEANPQNRVSVIAFSDLGKLVNGLSSNAAQVKASIDNMDAIGGTNLQDGLLLVENTFLQRTDKTGKPVVVVISDGLPTFYHPSLTNHTEANRAGLGSDTDWNEVKWTLDQAAQLKERTGAEIYTIGFGPESAVMAKTLKPDPSNVYSYDGYKWEKWYYTYQLYPSGIWVKNGVINQNNPLYPAAAYNYWVATPYQGILQKPTDISEGVFYSTIHNNYLAESTYRGTNTVVSGMPVDTPLVATNHWDSKYAYWEPESKVAGTDTDAGFLNRTLQEIVLIIINSPIKGDATVTDVIGEGFELVNAPTVDTGSVIVNNGTVVWTIPANDFPINVDGSAAVTCTFTVKLATTDPGEYWTNKQRDGDVFYNKFEFTPSDKNPYYPPGPKVVEIVGGEKVTIASLSRTVTGLVFPFVTDDMGLGQAFLDGFAITVELRKTYNTPADPSLITNPVFERNGVGRFTFNNVPFGEYVLVISRPGYLTRCMNVVVAQTDGDPIELRTTDGAEVFELWWGDVDDNQFVDGSDIMIIQGNQGFAYGDPRYRAACDFDATGLIDGSDTMLLLGNINKSMFKYPGAGDVNYDI